MFIQMIFLLVNCIPAPNFADLIEYLDLLCSAILQSKMKDTRTTDSEL